MDALTGLLTVGLPMLKWPTGTVSMMMPPTMPSRLIVVRPTSADIATLCPMNVLHLMLDLTCSQAISTSMMSMENVGHLMENSNPLNQNYTDNPQKSVLLKLEMRLKHIRNQQLQVTTLLSYH